MPMKICSCIYIYFNISFNLYNIYTCISMVCKISMHIFKNYSSH